MIKKIIIILMLIALISIILDFADALRLNKILKAFCYLILAGSFLYIGFYKQSLKKNE
ncbi:hypothetical protein [Yeosuana sp.]|uniref:hypothetical protein n=1 Tax=Yeosuana sp. TaxID=2529388 RepID=UPI00404ADA87